MKKILVIRFSSIGDIVLTTPVLRCLKKQLDVDLHFLTKASFAGLLENNPYVDRVHSITKDLDKTLVEQLKAEQFDQVIDLHNNLRTLRLKRALKVPSKSFPKLNVEKWLLVTFKWRKMPDLHIVDRYMETVKHLGVKNDGEGSDYFIPKSAEVALTRLPSSHASDYVALVIGGQHATKMMPVKKLVELCEALKEPVLLLGGPEDEVRGAQIAEAIGEKVYNACGKFKLDESASLLKQSSWVISHDTGLMHMAAAFKKRIVSVWGNTVPELGMYPYLPDPKSKIIQVPNLSYRPCSKIGYKKCPKGHFKCMDHDVNEMLGYSS